MINYKFKTGGFMHLLTYIGECRLWFAVSSIFSVIISLITLGWCYIIKKLLDSAQTYNYKSLLFFISLAALFFVLEAFVEMVLKYSTVKFQETIFYNIRNEFVSHILNLPIKYMESQKNGDIQSRYINDLNNLKAFFSSTVFDIIKQPLMFIFSLCYMLYLSWKLTLFCLVISPIFIFISVKITKPIYGYTKERNEALSFENSLVTNNLGGIAALKAFLLENLMHAKYTTAADKTLSKELKLTKINSLIQPLSFGMRVIPTLLSLGFGNYLLLNNAITIGSILAIVQLQNYVLGPVMVIPGILSSINSSKASLTRIEEILNEPEERTEGHILAKPHLTEAVLINNLTFAYENGANVLNNLSIQINNNELIALVGKSGCGKSTLLKLISGIYIPQKGTVKILGHSLEDWNIKNIRNLISIVSQDAYIYPDSIYKNILYGNMNSSEEDVINSAKAANIHDFIISLPNGYNTIVDEHALMLSGGQKQRICIARAILKDSPIILFDEPTSALDAENEFLINEAIKNLVNKHTVIIVAHRLSTIKNVSKILVMDSGEIQAAGTHEELINHCEIYKSLFYKQYCV